ncbi:MAG TPA: deoxyribose-phosphate aldolase [Polyangiaceae bacterium]|jgi:deoxyribose-phosphate aldolase|nr:MAG: Deoxyribose-phosphate aldolase 2 [Deltaproteobacteria bacterium ADurb.Bin207]HNS96701.1 deoxyribose-phosphate aldolase [Polyangiaceae bacterium]HNZ24319.1 deoxyribose-phosphate aldolase [Polyangiaceae bacterium]HOE49648.1 deoxyribose-phosphate aldolase [Polyangiaceae bacterium]HOH02379.1 deoxyribose-phosphate aldolase [Polyangiaceae bacterium]
MTSTSVALGSDHGGYTLKQAIKRHLTSKGLSVLDVGTHSTDACDYPVFARAAAEAVASGRASVGIVIDGAGIGSCMTANKVPGVRAGMAFDEKTARNAREHNDANLLTLGAGYLAEDLAIRIVDVFLSTECTVDRHKRRVAMIDALDGKPARSGSSMSSNDYQGLVDAITRVLTANPTMISSVLGASGATGYACADCSNCGNCASKKPETVRQVLGGVGGRISSSLGAKNVPTDMAKLIDHTLLKPEATYADIDRLCDEAREYGFASVCVNSMHVERCAKRLKGSGVKTCCVIGFPLGATPKEIKALEARRAIRDGAKELDMVIAIGALKSGDHRYVYEDIRLVAEAARDGSALLKVIIETGLLTDEQKVAACVLAKKARADFVKTSTGFGHGGATVHDVELMARAVDHQLQVKASGGVKGVDDAKKMVAAGASRIGASVGVKIVREAKGLSTEGASAQGGY